MARFTYGLLSLLFLLVACRPPSAEPGDVTGAPSWEPQDVIGGPMEAEEFWHDLSDQGRLLVLADGALYVETDPHSGEFAQIDSGVLRASWSPDGATLFYVVGEPADPYDLEAFAKVTDVRLWSALDGSVNPVSGLPADLNLGRFGGEATWSPDGRYVAFADVASYIAEEGVWLLERESNTLSLLEAPEERFYIQAIHWGADQIIVDYTQSIAAYKTDGERAWLQEFPSRRRDRPILISPDGSRVVLDTRPEKDGPYAVVVIEATNGGITAEYPLQDGQNVRWVSMSPDGSQVAVTVDRPHGLVLIDLETAETEFIDSAYSAVWRPGGGAAIGSVVDGGAPFGMTARHQLLLTDFAGGEQVIVEQDSVGGLALGWSPDGNTLVYDSQVRNHEPFQLTGWSAEDMRSWPLLENDSETDLAAIDWMPDSSGFYYLVDGHGKHLSYLDLTTGQVETVVQKPVPEYLNVPIHDLALAPDGWLWAATDLGVVSRDPDDGTVTRYGAGSGLFDGPYYTVFAAADGSIWVSGYEHVAVYDGARWTRFEHESGTPPLARDAESLVATEDGTVAFANAWGLYVYDGNRWYEDRDLHYATVALDDDGAIWAVDSGQLYQWDGSQWLLGGTMAWHRFPEEGALIRIDPEGIFWLHSYESVFSFDGQEATHFYLDDAGFRDSECYWPASSDDHLSQSAVGSGRETVTSSRSRASKLAPQAHVGRLASSIAALDEPAVATIDDAIITDDGVVWLATCLGLASFDGQRWEVYKAAGEIGAFSPLSLLADPEGGIWVGTWGNGVLYYDGQEWTQLAMK